MKEWLILAAASCVASLSLSTAAAEQAGDFALLDQKGLFHQIGYYTNYQAIALMAEVNGSTETEAAVPDFKKAAKKYGDKVKFFMINPTGNQDRDLVKRQWQAFETDIPVLVDYTQLPSEALGLTHAGQVVLVDPENFDVLYRGPVGKPLNAALKRAAKGKAVKEAEVAMSGESTIDYPARAQHASNTPSYEKDVAPILAENCARCHREGGIAPFAMNSHAMVQGWAPMIREVVLTKRMPPGQIDPHVGNFKETYTLTADEQQKLVHWIEAGAAKDGQEDPLTQLEWPQTKWAYGEPDLIINVPAQEIPATGVLDYIRIVVPIEGLDRDRYVKASQYVAGDRRVLHHTLNALVPPGETPSPRAFLGGGDPDQARITAYIPGAQPQHEPPNTGGLLKKGSSIALQLHYTTFGKATVDESEIGLWFYDDDEIPAERMSGQCACIFTQGWVNIPPYDPDHEMTKTLTLPKDAYLYSMLPHMHFRGKRMRFYAEYPDGRKEELLNIAKYNYNWQLDYQLEEPKFMPVGTKLIAVGAFDNSEQNPANPDPAREVPWGQQSWDEMFFGAMTWKWADQENKVAEN